MTSKILFILSKAPYQSAHGLEALEAGLVAGVFEQDVSVLFRDDGLWHLIRNQQGDAIGQRTSGKIASALPEYDVSKLFVCRDALHKRGLTPADLVLDVTVLDLSEQRGLIESQHAVVND